MTFARRARLEKELSMITKDPNPGISVTIPTEADDFAALTASIIGPRDSPYHSGVFQLSIDIPNRYPFEPPKVRFTTPIYHPNIDSDGRICLDTLKMQPQGSWSPCINLSTLLLSVRLLMAQPNPADGLVAEITEEYNNNYSYWFENALRFTRKHCLQFVKDDHGKEATATAISKEGVKQQSPAAQRHEEGQQGHVEDSINHIKSAEQYREEQAQVVDVGAAASRSNESPPPSSTTLLLLQEVGLKRPVPVEEETRRTSSIGGRSVSTAGSSSTSSYGPGESRKERKQK